MAYKKSNPKKLTAFLKDKEGNSKYQETKNGKEFIKVKVQGDFYGDLVFYPESGVISASLIPRLSMAERIELGVQEALKKQKSKY